MIDTDSDTFEIREPIVSDTPNTDGNGDDADKHKWDEDQDPHVSPGIEVVSSEELEHEQQEVNCQADQHGLVLNIFFCIQPGLRPPPPHIRPNSCTSNGNS